MSEAVSPPESLSRGGKLLGKSKWKERILSSEGRRKNAEEHESNETEVARFLHNSAPASTAVNLKTPGEANSVPQTTATPEDSFIRRGEELQGRPWPPPKLNTARVQTHSIAPPESDLSPIKDTYQRARPRMNKGLHVGFATTPPVLIGEGGDEAELPPRELTRSLSYQGIAHMTEPAPLQRISTGFATSRPSEVIPAPRQVLRDHERLEGKPNQREAVAEQVRKDAEAPMEEVEEENDSVMIHQPVPSLTVFPDHQPGIEQAQARSEPLEAEFSDSSIGASNSLTPLPSPMPPVKSQTRPARSYDFPAVGVLDNSPPPAIEASTSSHPRDTRDRQTSHERKALSIRNVAKSLGDDALENFDVRMSSIYSIFRTNSSTPKGSSGITFSAWTLSAAWWFIKGRMELEIAVRKKQKSPAGSNLMQGSQPPPYLIQAYIDLAKAWWIVKEIIPSHPEIIKYGNASISSMTAIVESFGDRRLAQLVQSNVDIIANLRALTMSMKRNNSLPPQPCEPQGSDLHILLEHPRLSPTFMKFISNNHHGSSKYAEFFPIPLGDSTRYFVLTRMFGRLSLASRHGGGDETRLTCLMTMMQSKIHGDLELLVASQDGQVNFSVRTEKQITSDHVWSQVQRLPQFHAISLPASQDADVKIAFQEMDFRTFCAICDQFSGVHADFEQRDDEKLIFESLLSQFERLEMPNEPGGFPQGSIKDCKSRLFSRKKVMAAGTGRRVIHQGYRLAVLTPPTLKHPRILCTLFNGDQAVLFNNWLEEDGLALTLRRPDSPSLLLAFRAQQELHTFRLMVSSTSTMKDDVIYPPLLMRGFYIIGCSAEIDASAQEKKTLCEMQWQRLQVIQRGRKSLSILDDTSPLRIIAVCDSGSFVDHMTLGPGELRLSLDVDDSSRVSLMRPAQSDMTWAFHDKLSKDTIQSLSRVIKQTAQMATTRTYSFCSQADANTFQATMTGFSVTFDRKACGFVVSRRRTVVPIHKKWEATTTRLQVLQRDGITQLVAFFKDFAHGRCLSMQLKSTDVFETSTKNGTFLLRIVEAKFALPKSHDDDEYNDFICLDIPEYASEHDDIMIVFNNENDRDLLASCLPAVASKASRLGSLRR